MLGGSLGMAIRQKGVATTVHAFVRREASVSECLERGAADHATLDLNEAVREAELIVLCTPIARMRELTEQMLPTVKPGALLTDVGSTKALLAAELEPLCANAGAVFIGSHPMAGSEKTGVNHAKADLFDGAVCALTPTERTDPKHLRQVEEFWKAVGCRTLVMPPDLHDELVSRCSHLPHVLAAILIHFALDPGSPEEQSVLAGTGLRDTTRLASGSPEMWRDICATNRKYLLQALEEFSSQLKNFQELLSKADAEGLMEFFTSVRKLRNDWLRKRFGKQ